MVCSLETPPKCSSGPSSKCFFQVPGYAVHCVASVYFYLLNYWSSQFAAQSISIFSLRLFSAKISSKFYFCVLRPCLLPLVQFFFFLLSTMRSSFFLYSPQWDPESGKVKVGNATMKVGWHREMLKVPSIAPVERNCSRHNGIIFLLKPVIKYGLGKIRTWVNLISCWNSLLLHKNSEVVVRVVENYFVF